jgi:hypothetical protein
MSNIRPPRKVDNPELRRVVDDIYKELIDIKKSVNQSYSGEPSKGSGKKGDIAVYKDSAGNNILACKTNDGWARIGLSVPKVHGEPFKGVGVDRDKIKLESTEALDLRNPTSHYPQIDMRNTGNDTSFGGYIKLGVLPKDNIAFTDAEVATSDKNLGTIQWQHLVQENTVGTPFEYGMIDCLATDTSAVSGRDSEIRIRSYKGNGAMNLTWSKGVLWFGSSDSSLSAAIDNATDTAVMNFRNEDTFRFSGGNADGEPLKLELWADSNNAGALLTPDNADKWLIQVADGGTMTYQSYISGSYATHLTITPHATATSSDITAAGTLSAGSHIYNGWHGHKTRIKILPRDFMVNDDSINSRVLFDEDAGGTRVAAAADELYATVAIPTGYKATHVRVFSSDTGLTVTAYEADINAAFDNSSNLGTGTPNAEMDITDLSSDDTNYLVIGVATAATDDLIYGGYVTIATI